MLNDGLISYQYKKNYICTIFKNKKDKFKWWSKKGYQNQLIQNL